MPQQKSEKKIEYRELVNLFKIKNFFADERASSRGLLKVYDKLY